MTSDPQQHGQGTYNANSKTGKLCIYHTNSGAYAKNKDGTTHMPPFIMSSFP